VQSSEPLAVRVIDSKPHSDNLDHDLKDVLGRPYLIHTTTWDSTQGSGYPVFRLEPLELLMAQPNFKDKISKFAYGTFTIKMRTMCNFTAVQAGKLLIGACPTAPGQDYITDGPARTFQLSTFRHVEVDAGTQEEVELTLPFFNDISCYQLSDTDPSRPGWQVLCISLNPLTGTTNNEVVDINVYAWLEDINLKMPTGQMAGPREGEKKQQTGIISTTLQTAADVAGSLATVPMLSQIAGPVAWASSAAAGVASFFGFSKPYNEGPNDRVTIVPASGMGQIDGADTSIKLTAMNNANVKQLADPDEMQISEIAKRQGLVARHKWKFSDPKNKILYSAEVAPALYNIYETPSGRRLLGCPPVAWLATMFLYWCGDISFRFSFAKNEFYTGKLLISFHPNTTEEQEGDDDQVYRRIVSLRNTNDVTVTIPYVYYKHWCRTNEGIGIIQVQVFNRLQSAAVVADTIEFNTWIFSNNIRFAVPATNLGKSSIVVDNTAPARLLTHHRTHTERKAAVEIAQGQILQTPNVAEDGHDDYLFGSPVHLDGEETTIGERIVSLRALTRRFNRFGFGTEGSYTLNSASFVVPDLDADSDTFATVTLQEYLSAAYRFMRGGIRVKMFTPSDTGLGFVNQASIGPLTPDAGGGWDDKGRKSGAVGYTIPNINGVIETEIPFYSDRERWFTYFKRSEVKGVSFTLGYVKTNPDGILTVNTDDQYPTYCAGADDFTHSMFIGVPIIFTNYA